MKRYAINPNIKGAFKWKIKKDIPDYLKNRFVNAMWLAAIVISFIAIITKFINKLCTRKS